MQVNSQRILWIDACKFVAISLVVIGHIVQFPFQLREVIFSFHMPLFFALSGIFITSSTQFTAAHIVKKFKTLIVPYFCFGLILIGAEAVYGHLMSHGLDDACSYLQTKLLQLVTFDRYGKLWFLPCLFVSQIILLAIYKVANYNKKIIIPTVSIIFVEGGVIINKLGIRNLPFSLDLSPIVVGFLYLGSYIPSVIRKIRLSHIIIAILVFVIAFCCNNYFFSPDDGYVVNMCQGQFGSIILFTIAAISGSIVTLHLSSKIRIKQLLFYGQNTLIIYGLHNIFKDIYPVIFIKGMTMCHFYVQSESMDCIVGLVTFILLMVTMIPTINIINKHLSFVLGRF